MLNYILKVLERITMILYSQEASRSGTVSKHVQCWIHIGWRLEQIETAINTFLSGDSNKTSQRRECLRFCVYSYFEGVYIFLYDPYFCIWPVFEQRFSMRATETVLEPGPVWLAGGRWRLLSSVLSRCLLSSEFAITKFVKSLKHCQKFFLVAKALTKNK